MGDDQGDDPAWTIAGARTKNGVMHRVPLTPLAVKIFSAAVADSTSPFVFPGRGRIDTAIDPSAVTRAMVRIRTALEIPDATVHDLRRTMGTNLARLGVSKDIRARVLNHVDGARSVTDAVYNQHEFWAEKRAALEIWETELRRIVGNQ
jgi:integrase